MSFADAANTLRALMRDNYSTTPVLYENDPNDQPTSGNWVEFYVRNGASDQVSMGAAQRRFRDTGVVMVLIKTGIGEGDGGAKELADEIAAIFRARTVGQLVLRTPSLEPMRRDGGRMVTPLLVPFYDDNYF